MQGEFWTHDPGLLVNRLVVVASERDRRFVKTSRVIRMEHGVGLSYNDVTDGSWPGGKGQTNVEAFLVPNEYAARAYRNNYPSVPVHVVGSPMMDRWHNDPPKPKNKRPLVVFSFHWDCPATHETRWSFPEYRDQLVTLLHEPVTFDIALHAHPLARKGVRKWAEANGIRFIWDFADVLRKADCYAVDNSSTLYEFASTDRPVVVLNSQHYRKKIHHGLRFWEHSQIGPNVWEAAHLKMAVEAALEGVGADERKIATELLFPNRGHAAKAAAELIKEIALA